MWRVMGKSGAERLTAAQIAKKSFAEWFLSRSALIPVPFTKHAMWCRCRSLNHKMHCPRMSRTGAHTRASGVGKHKDGSLPGPPSGQSSDRSDEGRRGGLWKSLILFV